MATAENSTVKLYRGVPLVKNGTEVLFLSGEAAEGVLSAFTAATFTKYYYTRENRGAVQVESPIGPLEGVNYIAFQNISHGGKWYFGFIDRLVYINDNNTQVEFTIDPFPTYLGECVEFASYFVLRNTPKTDIRGANIQEDFFPKSKHLTSVNGGELVLPLSGSCIYFTQKGSTSSLIDQTGIRTRPGTSADVEDVLAHDGSIIGGYLLPSGWTPLNGAPAEMKSLGTLSCNPFTGLSGYTHEKIRSGVYNTVSLVAPQSTKSFDIEAFNTPQNISFRALGLWLPCPSVFIYPLNYNGIAENIGEGILTKVPSIPITANPVYTSSQAISDLSGVLMSAGTSAISGMMTGGPTNALANATISAGLAGAQAVNRFALRSLEPPHIIGTGEPVLGLNKELRFSLVVRRPDANDLARIDSYFDYYGYAVNANSDSAVFSGGVNQDDGAYLQTGSDMFGGSEKSAEINARIAAGIKIRKTL